MFLTNGQVHVYCQPKKLHNPECLVLTVKGSGGSVMLWGHIFFAWFECSHSLRRLGQCQSLLNGTEWSYSPHVAAFLSCQGECLPGWQSPHPQSTSVRPMIWWAWHWCYPYVMAFSVTRSEHTWAFMGYFGRTLNFSNGKIGTAKIGN